MQCYTVLLEISNYRALIYIHAMRSIQVFRTKPSASLLTITKFMTDAYKHWHRGIKIGNREDKEESQISGD